MSQFPDEQNSDGEFTRQEDAFRHWILDDGESAFTPEKGRYHLYVSLACPWAHRTLIARHLLGLEDCISVGIVDPVRDERGWAFRDGACHCKDAVNGFHFLAEAYQASDASFSGRITVPVLWDRQTGAIVNNSEDDICWMFAHAFQRFHTRECNLFPAELRDAQKDLSEFVYEKVNNGVYKAGFASSQAGYERAAQELFAALDELEERLTGQRYLLGDALVETDWRLFCTLIRFDAVYHGHFKCNLRQLRDYKNLSAHVRHLYQLPGIRSTVSFDHIKRHYYMTHEDINPSRIVPIGPDLRWLDTPVE